jgi:hypothetical protein
LAINSFSRLNCDSFNPLDASTRMIMFAIGGKNTIDDGVVVSVTARKY